MNNGVHIDFGFWKVIITFEKSKTVMFTVYWSIVPNCNPIIEDSNYGEIPLQVFQKLLFKGNECTFKDIK